MKFIRVLILLILVVSLAIGTTLPVGATPILHEYFTTAGDANSVNIYGGNWVAEQFTSEATSHTVSSIKVELLRVGTPNAVTVGLYNAVAGVPTTQITSVTYTGTILSTAYTMYEFDITDQSLLPSTQYAIVVSCPSGDNANYIQWHQVNAGGLANAIGSDSANSGVSWVVDAGGADYLFQIYGNPVFQVVGAQVFSDYYATGDWLICFETINAYPTYYNNVTVSRYFNVQLLDVAGTTVLAATTLKSWGDSPGAIYLSPSSVIPLTYGSAFQIRMIGLFAGAPTTTYVLQSTDWVGSDLTYLDQWCLGVAKRMNSYDNNTATNPYTTVNSDIGEILTTYGGGKFVTGIPMIMNLRPTLFQTVITQPDYDYDTATNAFDLEFNWAAQVGSTIAADAASFGSVLGITAKQFLSMGIWVVYLFSMAFVMASSKGQGAETVFVIILNAPILLMGLHYRLIDFQIFAIACILALLIFLMKAWFSK